MESVLSNKVLLIPAGAWFVAQVLKVIISSIRDGRLDLSYMVSMGGMPSSHATVVSSLATTIAVVDGMDTPLFAVAVFFAIVVMYDAAGVRQTVSSQSAMLNRILDELFKGSPAFEERLRELIGHSYLQVIAGATLGIIIALLWTWAS